MKLVFYVDDYWVYGNFRYYSSKLTVESALFLFLRSVVFRENLGAKNGLVSVYNIYLIWSDNINYNISAFIKFIFLLHMNVLWIFISSCTLKIIDKYLFMII